jgi:hypothetical protein
MEIAVEFLSVVGPILWWFRWKACYFWVVGGVPWAAVGVGISRGMLMKSWLFS